MMARNRFIPRWLLAAAVAPLVAGICGALAFAGIHWLLFVAAGESPFGLDYSNLARIALFTAAPATLFNIAAVWIVVLPVHANLQRIQLARSDAYAAAGVFALLALSFLPYVFVELTPRCEYDVCNDPTNPAGWFIYGLAVLTYGASNGFCFWLVRRPDRDQPSNSTPS